MDYADGTLLLLMFRWRSIIKDQSSRKLRALRIINTRLVHLDVPSDQACS